MGSLPLALTAALAVAAVHERAVEAREPAASPLLPPDHWSVQAAERLHEIGLLPDWMPAQRAAPILAVARALESAADEAERTAPAYAPIARAWLGRFRAEWPGVDDRTEPSRSAALLGASASLGFEAGSTREPAAPTTPPGALLLSAPGSNAFTSATAAATVGEHLAAGATFRATPSDVRLPAVEIVGALGPVQLSVGRAGVGYGPNQVGGVVATGAAVDRVELMTTRPFRLPGFLDFMGDFAFDTAVARFSEPRHPYTPLLWEFDLQWRPHPRLTVGAVRGVMFGGALWAGIPAGDIPLTLLGIKNHEGDATHPGLENNVYSGTIQYRLPTEALLPLTGKLEWGTDDSPGAAFNWPGLVVGLTAPMLPRLPASLGVEYAYFGPTGLGHHDRFGWYTHDGFVGGWATGESPLGDPLGGNGRALRLVASADPWGPRVRLSGAAWVADRFVARLPDASWVGGRWVDNLYAHAAGRSVGARGEAELRLGRAALGLRAAYERGRDGWSRGEITASAITFF